MLKYTDLSNEIKKSIVNDMLNSTLTEKELRNKYNIGCRIYKKIKDEFNIRKTTVRKKKFKCNENFFEVIDTEEKAYWLGFLYADGCVQQKGNYYTTKIDLATIDRNHIEKFKKSLDSNHNINDYKDHSKIVIGSKKMFNDLNNKGCVPKKTLILEFPTIEQVPEHLVHHFIRGYFDGDGTINIMKQFKTPQARFQLLGTYDFLKGVCDFLYPYIGQVNIHKTRGIYVIQISGNKKAKMVFDLLYKDSTIYLDRKHDKYLKHFYS